MIFLKTKQPLGGMDAMILLAWSISAIFYIVFLFAVLKDVSIPWIVNLITMSLGLVPVVTFDNANPKHTTIKEIWILGVVIALFHIFVFVRKILTKIPRRSG